MEPPLDPFCYEATALPEDSDPAWTSGHSPDPLVTSTVEISPAGFLHILSTNTDESAYWIIRPNAVDSIGLMLTFRMKVISGTTLGNALNSYIGAGTDLTTCAISFATDGIETNLGNYAFDTTNDYHVYRMTIRDGFVEIYVDDVLVLDGEPGATSELNAIEFNPMGNVALEQYWDYICVDTAGVFPSTSPSVSPSPSPAPPARGARLLTLGVS